MAETANVQEYIEHLPSAAEIRARIAANVAERQLLRRLLKLAEEREGARELSK